MTAQAIKCSASVVSNLRHANVRNSSCALWHLPHTAHRTHQCARRQGVYGPQPAHQLATRSRNTIAKAQPSMRGSTPIQSLDEAIVEEIMVPHPVTLTADMTCKSAARALLDNDMNSAPVVDKSGRLIGVLSESDLLWKGAGAPLDHTIIPPVYVGAFDLLFSLRDTPKVNAEIDKILARTVGEAMTKQPVHIKPSDLLSTAAHVMLANKVYSLPVVDEGGKVVGIVSQHDILRGMVAEQLPLL